VARATEQNPATALASVLRALLRTSLPAFTADWREYLRIQLG
jgi:hypothetical protein